jgi:hypothetical protein
MKRMKHIKHTKVKFKISFFLINLGIKLLPANFRTKEFINNIMSVNIITVNKIDKDNPHNNT